MDEFQTLGEKEESRRQEAFFGLITLRLASDSPAPSPYLSGCLQMCTLLVRWQTEKRKSSHTETQTSHTYECSRRTLR